MTHIFISYSRKDLAIAEKIINVLAKDDLEPWVDWKSIAKGEKFEREIQQGIEKAEVFLFLVSPNSVQSKWCIREIDHAVKNGKRILPIVINDADPTNIPLEISSRNWIFCREEQDDFNKAIEEIHNTIHTDYEWLRYHTDLQLKALKWKRMQKSYLLLKREEIQEVSRHLEDSNTQKDPLPTRLQYEYLFLSLNYEKKRRNRFVTALIIGIISVLSLLLFAWQQRSNFLEQELQSSSGRLSSASSSLREGNLSLSLLLGIESVKLYESPESVDVLLKNLQYSPFLRHLIHTSSSALALDYNPKDNLLVVVHTNGNILLWDVEDYEVPKLLGEVDIGYVNDFATIYLSSNGERLITHTGAEIIVWDISNLNKPNLITRLGLSNYSSSYALAISVDNKILASLEEADVGHAIVLREIEESTIDKPYAYLEGNQFYITDLLFDASGEFLFSASLDGSVIIWDLSSHKDSNYVKKIILNADDSIYTLALSSDNNILAAGDGKGFVYLWNVHNPQNPINLGVYSAFHNVGISSIAFSRNNKLLAIGSDNGSVGFLYSQNEENTIFYPEEEPITGNNWDVLDMGFSDTNNLFSAGIMNESIVMWSMDQETPTVWPGELLPEDSLFSPYAVFSPARDLYAIGDRKSGTVKIWQKKDNRFQSVNEIKIEIDFNLLSTQIAFSPNGKILAIEGVNGSFSLWSVSNPSNITKLGETDVQKEAVLLPIRTITFLPQGNVIVTTHDNGEVKFWNVSEPSNPTQLKKEINHNIGSISHVHVDMVGMRLKLIGFNGSIMDIDIKDSLNPSFIEKMELHRNNDLSVIRTSLSQNGDILATIDYGNNISSVTLWNLKEKHPTPFGSPFDDTEGVIISSISISNDNKYLVVSHTTGVNLWNIENPSRPMKIGYAFASEDTYDLSGAWFSYDNSLVFSIRDYGRVDLDLDIQSLINKTCLRAGRNFTQSEWRQFFPNESYRLTCPQYPVGE